MNLSELRKIRATLIIESYLETIDVLISNLRCKSTQDEIKYYLSNNNIAKGILILYDSLYEEIKHDIKKKPNNSSLNDVNFFNKNKLKTLKNHNIFAIINIAGNSLRHMHEWQFEFKEVTSNERIREINKLTKQNNHVKDITYLSHLTSMNKGSKRKMYNSIKALNDLGFKLEIFLRTDSEFAYQFIKKFELTNTKLTKKRINKLIMSYFN